MKPERPLKQVARKYHKVYGHLHDQVSDIVEDGELEGVLDPKQYRKLVNLLSGPCNRADASMKKALKEDR